MMIALWVACAPSWGEPEPVAVWDGWRLSTADEPFGAAPADVYCDPLGWGPELFGPEPALQVWTAACPWVTVEQPSRVPLERGDRLSFRLWHDPLSADAPATAWIGLAADTSVLAWWSVPIPAPSGPVLDDLELAVDFPEGTPIRFHVHNHGNNTYHLLELSRLPRE
jgi:hypothetical protein